MMVSICIYDLFMRNREGRLQIFLTLLNISLPVYLWLNRYSCSFKNKDNSRQASP